MTSPVEQSRYVDLTDNDLRDLIGATFEAIKKLQEAKKGDAELLAMAQRKKDIEDERYNVDIRAMSRTLKAMREVAQARGLKFRVPKLEVSDE